MAQGKTTPFVEDTNLPFVVRGPGVPEGAESNLVGSHLDLAPTFLDIARLDKKEWPSFLDGRSLFRQWKDPLMEYPEAGQGNNYEVLNVEFWGGGRVAVGGFVQGSPAGTYKTIRIAGDGFGYLYSVWCGGPDEVELYDTIVSSVTLFFLPLHRVSSLN